MLPDPADIGTFAEVVRGVRKQLNLSQNDLAALVCMASRPTVTGNDIARYERGKRIARQEIRRALEEVLASIHRSVSGGRLFSGLVRGLVGGGGGCGCGCA